jgi:signal transduction histidine kinase
MRTLLRWLFVSTLLLALHGGGVGVVEIASAAGTKHVLVLYSTRRDAPISVAGERELPRILEDGLNRELDHGLAYYSEYVDQGRFPDPAYQEAFHDFLRVKYQGLRFDVVIVVSPEPRRLPNSTGVVGKLDLVSTITLAAELQPDLRNIFVVSGTAVPDKRYEADARKQLRPLESRFVITYLSGLATNDLDARLAALPAHSMVYYLVVYRDGAGNVFSPMDYLERVAAAARVPTYSWVDTTMGHGVVGGSLLDSTAMLDAIAKVALRVLQGEEADTIAISSPDLNVHQVDWRQLRRWGISEARVPAGTLIQFRVESIWDRYTTYILGAVALFLAQATLIAGLLLQRSRRQQAEAEVRGGQVKLRDSYDRIRDLGARLLTAQEAERSRIARELHDDIGQQLAVLHNELQMLAGREEADPLRRELDGISSRTHAVTRGLHDLSHRLHPAYLGFVGLTAALERLRRELSTDHLAITFTHESVPATIPPEVKLCLYRVAQEGLRNAVRHSGATAVAVRLSGDPDRLTMSIRDNGKGFDVRRAQDGLGLVSMSERVAQISGALRVRSVPGAGTELEITVPWSEEGSVEAEAV